jgi:hypothetical protein
MGLWAKSVVIFNSIRENGQQSIRRLAEQTGLSIERVAVPLTGVALSAPQLKEHDGQHEIGPMRRFASTAVSLVEGNQVEGNHGVSNLPREMIVG